MKEDINKYVIVGYNNKTQKLERLSLVTSQEGAQHSLPKYREWFGKEWNTIHIEELKFQELK